MKQACLLDISRYRVPTLARMKKMLRKLAGCGYNEVFFNIEHSFKIPEHPRIGLDADGYSEADFKTLDNYACSLGLMLVPIFQSLGHLFHILKWNEYAHLRESEDRWSIRPCYDESFTLLEEYYSALARCFRSEYIHIGGDEVYDLASGVSEHLLTGYKTKKELFIDHCVQLEKILATLNRKMMIWGDMLEEQDNTTGQKLLSRLSTETVICYWHYGTEPMPEFYKTLKNRLYLCPGIHTWRGLFLRKKEAENNLLSMASKMDSIVPCGFIITDWGDCGHIHSPALTEKLLEWAIHVFTKKEPNIAIDNNRATDKLINLLSEIHSGAWLNSSPVSNMGEKELVTRLLFHEYIFRGKGFLEQSEDQLNALINKIEKMEALAIRHKFPEFTHEGDSGVGYPEDEFISELILLVHQTTLLKKRANIHLSFRMEGKHPDLEQALIDLIFEGRRWFSEWMKHWLDTSQPMGIHFHIHFWKRTEENIMNELQFIQNHLPHKHGDAISIYQEDGWRNLYSICDMKALLYEWEKYKL